MSRSLLTLLGIAIGIMAIISLMALGEGMQQAVTGEALVVIRCHHCVYRRKYVFLLWRWRLNW